jgi:cell division protein ZapA
MAQVTVKINGYAYTLGCENGQEQHLLDMAREVESRIESIKALGGPTGEGRLLVLAALLMADELHDTGIELASLRSAAAEIRAGSQLGDAEHEASAEAAKTDIRQAKRLSRLARKAEDIATSIEQP